MAEFYAILTNKGLVAYAAATAAETALDFAEFAVGDGGGAYFDPLPTQVSLVNEVWRGSINRIYVHPNNADWAVIEAIIPASAGGFDIREAGIFDSSGNLLAAAKYPLTTKPAPGSGSEKDLYVRMILEISNAATVIQEIDPSLVMATKEYVDSRDWRESARAATTGSIADLAAGAPDTLDGITLAVGDRVFVKDQADGSANGLYAVETLGTGADGIWVRAPDADNALEVTANFTVAVEEGTENADSVWLCTTDAPIALGTTVLTFKRLITQTELDAHTALAATTTVTGHVKLATNAETVTGTEAGKATTPAGVSAAVYYYVSEHAAVAASETEVGHVELATEEEAVAGEDTEKAVTSAGLAAAVSVHADRTDNPHGVTAAQAGADPVGSATAVQANLEAHAGRTDNPHGVTAGSLLDTDIQSPAAGNILVYDAADGTWKVGTSAPKADKLTTARTISLTGEITGSVSFDGSADIAVPATLNKFHTAGSTYSLQRPLKQYNSITNSITKSTSYIDAAFFELGPNYGSFRFSFDLGCSNSSYTSYGRLYLRRAGVDTPIGIERSRSDDDPATYTEDISNLQRGDVIVLKIKSSNVNNIVICSFFEISSTEYSL
jgi:phage-related tail fiber protein